MGIGHQEEIGDNFHMTNIFLNVDLERIGKTGNRRRKSSTSE